MKAAHLLVLCAVLLYAASGAYAEAVESRLATRNLESASLGGTVSYSILLPRGRTWIYWDKQIVEFLQVAAGVTNRPDEISVKRSQ